MNSRLSWLDSRIEVFLAESQRLGLTMSRARIAVALWDKLDDYASLMRISEVTARCHLTDDMVRGMARSIAASITKDAPHDHRLDLPETPVTY